MPNKPGIDKKRVSFYRYLTSRIRAARDLLSGDRHYRTDVPYCHFACKEEIQMGVVRSPEIGEKIYKNRERIERNLNFLRGFLYKNELVTLQIFVTKERVTLSDEIRIDISDLTTTIPGSLLEP